jgi:hypothetical protein
MSDENGCRGDAWEFGVRKLNGRATYSVASGTMLETPQTAGNIKESYHEYDQAAKRRLPPA